MSKKITALIPARGGSLRVPNKNIRLLSGHPVIAYTIKVALESEKFESVIVASDSQTICDVSKYYGANIIVKRGELDSTHISPDIDWLTNLYNSGYLTESNFAILRPTSPLRSIKLIANCIEAFIASGSDSLRTISKVKEHPGKMWVLNQNCRISPYLEQTNFEHTTHSMQYQSLQELYIQTSVFEIAKTSVIPETRSREGNTIMGFITDGIDSHSIDSESDYNYLEYLVSNHPNLLPSINIDPIELKK